MQTPKKAKKEKKAKKVESEEEEEKPKVCTTRPLSAVGTCNQLAPVISPLVLSLRGLSREASAEWDGVSRIVTEGQEGQEGQEEGVR